MFPIMYLLLLKLGCICKTEAILWAYMQQFCESWKYMYRIGKGLLWKNTIFWNKTAKMIRKFEIHYLPRIYIFINTRHIDFSLTSSRKTLSFNVLFAETLEFKAWYFVRKHPKIITNGTRRYIWYSHFYVE